MFEPAISSSGCKPDTSPPADPEAVGKEKAHPPMRVVLRNTHSGLYLQEGGAWTGELPHARVFRHSAEAMDTARDCGLKGLEVLLVFEEPQYNVTLPLPLH